AGAGFAAPSADAVVTERLHDLVAFAGCQVGASLDLVGHCVGLGVCLGDAGVDRCSSHRGNLRDGETNWFTITTFRQLAGNVRASLDKGHRVVVAGRLRV